MAPTREAGRPLLADFGCAAVLSADDDVGLGSFSFGARVSEFRFPPETIRGVPTGPSNHVWQLGALFGVLCLGHDPVMWAVLPQRPDVAISLVLRWGASSYVDYRLTPCRCKLVHDMCRRTDRIGRRLSFVGVSLSSVFVIVGRTIDTMSTIGQHLKRSAVQEHAKIVREDARERHSELCLAAPF